MYAHIYITYIIYIRIYIYYIHTIDIVSLLFVFLTDIARQVAKECDWPAARNRMMCKCRATLASQNLQCLQRIPEAFQTTVSLWWRWGVKTLEMRVGPWTNVRTNETWMSFRFGVNRNVWSPVFLQGGMEVHATNAFIRDRNKGTIHVHTRDQLKVIEDVANDRWSFFGLLLFLLRAERFVAPAIHKGLA